MNMTDQLSEPTVAALNAAETYGKQQASEINLEARLKVAFMEGVLFGREQELERLRGRATEVTNA
jgi:hypothetical protein